MNRPLIFLLGVVAAAIAIGLGLALREDGAGTFVTKSGTTEDPATGWRVVVDPDTARHTLMQGASSLAPLWTMQPGWFVYLENDKRAWSFDGEDRLLLFVAGSGDDAGAFLPDRAPFAVPEPVVYRIGEHRIRQIADKARAARERLGLAPDR